MSNTALKTFDIFVGGLPHEKSEEDVRAHFNKYGSIHSCSMKPGNRGDNTNICYVRYTNKDEATAAVEDNLMLEWDGVRIPVQAASRGGNSWYSGTKIKRGNDGRKYLNKPDKTHVGHHGLRQMDGSGDSKAEIVGTEEIVLSFQESPIVFWAQQMDRSTELRDLSDQLQQVCAGGQSLTNMPSQDKIYASMYSSDGEWYRCRALRTVSDIKVEVLFLDFGNTEVKEFSEIKELLPNLAAIRPLAQRYCLYGLSLAHDTNSVGFHRGCQKLAELTEGKAGTATVYNTNETGAIPVILFCDNVDVNQAMLSLEHAVCAKKQDFKPDDQCHLPTGHQGHAASMKTNMKVGQWMPEAPIGPAGPIHSHPNGAMLPAPPKAQRHRDQNSNNMTGNQQQQQHIQLGDAWGQGGGGGDQQRSSETVRLHQEIKNLQKDREFMAVKMHQIKEAALKETAVIKREWDSAVLELEASRATLKKYQDDYRELVLKQSERSLPQRFSRLVQSVERVKAFRIQFPTEGQCEDPIEQVFDVANDSQKIVTRELPISKTVEKCLCIYRTTQNAIRASESVEELPGLTAARDQSRIDLHAALTTFISTAQELPLSERSEQVERMLTLLRTTYPAFLVKDSPLLENVTNFEEATKQYREWKTQKVTEFQESRTRTNTCHNGINNALRTLQEQLSLDSGISASNVTTCVGLDQLLDSLQEAVDEEARKTNLVSDVNEADAVIVTTLLKALEGELHRELADIVHLRRLLAEYSSMANVLEPWLYQKPQLEPITAIRKQIKSVKSKLRHKLADLQDLEEEESDASGSDDLVQLREELAAIRLQLHTAFLKEDEILGDLAELNESHFPELNPLHQDLMIEVFKQYNGLVKQGRALDQFLLEPMPNTKKKNIYKAVFCGQDCVLKEYIIDDLYGVKRSEFLRRAFFYNQIINPNILPIQALFFTGAGRQAYVQLAYYEKNLSKLISEGPVSVQQAYHILCKVLTGLQAIHSANLVFGAVHPNNILINQDNSVVLAELDFSKSPHQRAGSFTTSNKLCFQPPEFARQEISWASDMFNFGLLALWLHFPSYKFSLRPNSVPDFSPLEMDRSLEELLVSLLQDEPASRRMAGSTWQLPYFANSPHSRPSSPKASLENETLQLRPRSDVRASVPKNGNGILKNKGTTSPTSSPVLSPQSSQRELPQLAVNIKIEPNLTEPKENDPNEDTLTEGIVNEESEGSTPVLVCSPMNTPLNTPVERASGSSSPPEGQHAHAHNCMETTTGLVKTAMLQASKLADLQPDEEDAETVMPALEAVNGDADCVNGLNGDVDITYPE